MEKRRTRQQQGRERRGHVPRRTCVGCRTEHEAQALLRFVCTPEGFVKLDGSRHGLGRGVYTCCDRQCIQRGLQVTKVGHVWQHPVQGVDLETLYHDISQLLRHRVQACLQLGQKAGALLSGYALVQRGFLQRRVCFVLLAEDTARERLAEYQTWCRQYQVPFVLLFTKDELGRMLGKTTSRSALGVTEPQMLTQLCPRLHALEQWRLTSSTA